MKSPKRSTRSRSSAAVLPQPVFNEGSITPDPTGFLKPHPSDTKLYNAIATLLKKDVVAFPESRAAAGDVYSLQDAYGPHGREIVAQIKRAKKIIFHSAGDSGASNSRYYPGEIGVADQLTHDCGSADVWNRPAFLFHLGDVVYDFGESKYYYDQFYEPYRNYPAPIFAIPGNHDSFVVPNTPPGETPLDIFTRNFCSPDRVITQEAVSLHRTAMTQPGVYFTLDAPFVRIIGLFSNALEDPGLISSQNGKWSGVPDHQLEYLTAQLKAIKDTKYAGAVLLAVHHPPFSYSPAPKTGGAGGNHSSSSDMLREIDTICAKVGVYPHAFLSGHAHNYQRFTRSIRFGSKNYDVPFVVCGDSGHHVNTLVRAAKGQTPADPHFNTDVSYLENKPAVQSKGVRLKRYDDTDFGYLRITVDAKTLQIAFHQVGAKIAQSRADVVSVDLASHTIVGS